MRLTLLFGPWRRCRPRASGGGLWGEGLGTRASGGCLRGGVSFGAECAWLGKNYSEKNPQGRSGRGSVGKPQSASDGFEWSIETGPNEWTGGTGIRKTAPLHASRSPGAGRNAPSVVKTAKGGHDSTVRTENGGDPEEWWRGSRRSSSVHHSGTGRSPKGFGRLDSCNAGGIW